MSAIAARLLQGCRVSPEPCHLKHQPLANPLAALELLIYFCLFAATGHAIPSSHMHVTFCAQNAMPLLTPLMLPLLTQ